MKHNSVTTIKSRFSNLAHKLLDPNYGNKRSEAWKNKKDYSNDEKIKIFDELKQIHDECSEEIGRALWKRREKRRIHKQRLINGYYEKKQAKKQKLVE